MGKGELIGTSSHEDRDMSQSVKDLDTSVKELLDNNEAAIEFLNQLHVVRNHYYRDQLLEIKKLHKEWGTNAILDAITY